MNNRTIYKKKELTLYKKIFNISFIRSIKHRYREMVTLTNKQRFILNTLLTLAAISLGVGLLVAFINMSINQGTCELFRVMLSTAIITVSLTTFFIVALDRYSTYNKHNFKYYSKD